MQSYNNVYFSAKRKLRDAGVAAYELEARLIVAYASGKTREDIILSGESYITDAKVRKAIDGMIDRRIRGEPVAYIVGEWEFYGIPLTVGSDVLIPRVDTEIIAGEVIRLLSRHAGKTRLLDLCAGSGCIGLAVAANVPDCRVVLADNSDGALAICRANMLRNRLSGRTIAVKADALSEPRDMLGKFDIIACNPPYIPTADIQKLEASVRCYEPVCSLDGGADGLYFFRAITRNWAAALKSGGQLAFECGTGQAKALRAIMKEGNFTDIRTYLDTLGIERVVIGSWLPEAATDETDLIDVIDVTDVTDKTDIL